MKSWKKTVTAGSVDVFKRRLDAEWSSRERQLILDATDHATAGSH